MADNSNQQPKSNTQENIPLPWLMLGVAALFDLVGVIPILNFFTETLAGLTLGLWQKSYAPKTNPLTTFLVAKTIDAISLGFLPSNIGIVAYAYIKKKAASKIQSAGSAVPFQASYAKENSESKMAA